MAITLLLEPARQTERLLDGLPRAHHRDDQRSMALARSVGAPLERLHA